MDGTEFRCGDPDLEVNVLVDPDGRVFMVASRNGFILWRNPLVAFDVKGHLLVEFFVNRTWEVDRTPLVAWGVDGSDTDGEAGSEVLAKVVEDTEATDTEIKN
jgi:hypothetical protein